MKIDWPVGFILIGTLLLVLASITARSDEQTAQKRSNAFTISTVDEWIIIAQDWRELRLRAAAITGVSRYEPSELYDTDAVLVIMGAKEYRLDVDSEAAAAKAIEELTTKIERAEE